VLYLCGIKRLNSFHLHSSGDPMKKLLLIFCLLSSQTLAQTTQVPPYLITGTLNNAVMTTNGSGLSAYSTTLPSGLTYPSPLLTGTISVGGNVMTFPSAPSTLAFINGAIISGRCAQFTGTAGAISAALTACGSGGGGNVQQVVCLNNTGDAALIQTAINTGSAVHINGGTCDITSTLSVQNGQLIYGDGRTETILNASGVSNVINCPFSEPGPIFQDFGVAWAAQSSNSAIAFNCTSTPRAKYFRIRTSYMGTAIAMTGNSGGTVIDDLECGTYGVCVQISGSFDRNVLSKIECFPFGTGNGAGGSYEAGATCVQAGRSDDLKIDNLLSVDGNCINLISGFSFGEAGIIDCDTITSTGLTIASSTGWFTVASYFASSATAGTSAITNTGGQLSVAAAFFTFAASSTTPMVSTTSGGFTLISGGQSWTAGADVPLSVCSGSPTYFDLSNFLMNVTANVAYSNAKILQDSSCRVTLNANRITDKGTGSGIFIQLATDDYHNVVGNSAPGWTNSNPTATNAIVYLNNPEFPNPRAN
jgi:hypothetical protein